MSDHKLFIAKGVEVSIESDDGMSEDTATLDVLVRQFDDGTVNVCAKQQTLRSRWSIPDVVAVEQFKDGTEVLTGTDEHRAAVVARLSAEDEPQDASATPYRGYSLIPKAGIVWIQQRGETIDGVLSFEQARQTIDEWLRGH